MSDIINEALLEMHFHSALIDYFKRRYGADFLKLLKPSSQQEKWVGFDQGWAHTFLSQAKLLEELKNAIHSKRQNVNNFYLGYFLQFKKVNKIGRKSLHIPSNYTAPYYRSVLSLKPNKVTGLSQHETLLILNNINNASVYYCCPMFFSLDEVYKKPDINKLRMVPISSAPTGWVTTTPHFITFQTPTDPLPIWHSKSVEGESISFETWASEDRKDAPRPLDASALITLINDTIEIITKNIVESKKENYFNISRNKDTQIIPESMTIIELQKKD